MLVALFFDPKRMRIFLSIILEVDDDPNLQPILYEHGKDCVLPSQDISGGPTTTPMWNHL